MVPFSSISGLFLYMFICFLDVFSNILSAALLKMPLHSCPCMNGYKYFSSWSNCYYYENLLKIELVNFDFSQ